MGIDSASSNPSANATLPADAVNRKASNRGITAQVLARFALTHPYSTITAVALFIMGIGAVLKHGSEWDTVYVGAALALRQGKDIYHDLIGYTYPPFSAWAMLPFTLVPIRLARGVWFVISACSLVYLIKSAWRLSGGSAVEPLSHPLPSRRREQIAFLIGHAVALQLTLNGLTHLQPDILIAAMLIAGCSAIIGGKYFRAATWIGAAAAFKATPLLFAPYLVWRKQWAAASWLVFVAIAANLLPDTVHRPANDHFWLTNWYHQYLAPMTTSKYVPGDWQNKLDNNQALAGAANRWLATTWATIVPPPDAKHPSPRDVSRRPEFTVIERPNRAGPKFIRAFFALTCLAVVLPAAWAMWKRRGARDVPRSSDPAKKSSVPGHDSSQVGPLPGQTILECGIIMLLMLLLSPNSSRAHFCVMYPAAFCVARIAVRPRASLLVRLLLAAAVISSTLSIHLRLPGSETAEQIMLWIGVVMLSTIFLLFASVAALFSTDASDAPSWDPQLQRQ